MRGEFDLFTKAGHVTSSPIKRAALNKLGYPVIDDHRVLDAVGRAEGKNPLIIADDHPENPVVMAIARQKALGLVPMLQYLYILGGQTTHLSVNDTVWSFAFPNNGTRTRTVINKPLEDGDIPTLRAFYKEAQNSLAYSSAGVYLVTPDPRNPTPYSIMAKLRFGTWVGEVPEDFSPNRAFSFGMNAVDALTKGHIVPHEQMKFEVILYDDTALPLRTQSNFSTRIPFTGDAHNLTLIQALGSGIIDQNTFEQLGDPVRVQKYLVLQ